MKNISKTFLSFLAFVLFIPVINAQSDFITPQAFLKISKDKNTVVISTQSEKNYKVSHLINSIYIKHKDLTKPTGPEGVLKTPTELAKIFGSKGVSDKNTIVIYDDGKNKNSTRMYWILKYLGAPNVKLLHKNMATWRKARLPITKAPTKVKPTTFTAKVNKAIAADFTYVKAHLTDSKVVFVDARSAAEFNGTNTKEPSKGHIPGAKNLEWKEVEKENGALKSNAELQKLFDANGITKNKTIVLYCGTSVRAAIIYVALKDLGYNNVKIYDGAYNEWVAKGGKVVK